MGTRQPNAVERQKQLVALLEAHKSCSISEMSRVLDVTPMTIRRDLHFLAEKQIVEVEHGFARFVASTQVEPNFDIRMQEHFIEKQAIGRRATELFVGEGDVIGIDSGSTATEIAAHLPDVRLTVVTHSLAAAKVVAKKSLYQLIVLGGTLHHASQCFYGPQVIAELRNLHISKLFLATRGLLIPEGLSSSDLPDAEVKQALIGASRQVILCMDSSKIGQASLAHFASLESIHTLVTDDNIALVDAESLRNYNIQVIMAPTQKAQQADLSPLQQNRDESISHQISIP